MHESLINEAYKVGMKGVVIDALVVKEDGKVLLVENLEGPDRFYHFPNAKVKKGETISQAIQRAVMNVAPIGIKSVLRYLGHYDIGDVRHLNFAVLANEPYAVEENKSISFAWLEFQEAVGYPVHDEAREMLDLYLKS